MNEIVVNVFIQFVRELIVICFVAIYYLLYLIY